MNGIARLYGQYVAAPLARFILQNTLLQSLGFQDTVQDLTFGAAITVDLNGGAFCRVTQSSNAAHTIGAPTAGAAALGAAHTGARLSIMFRNTSGGAAGATTFNAVFKLQGGAWVNAATANSRTGHFIFDGTNWVEIGRSAADVAN